MAARWGVGSNARQRGLGLAQGVCVGMLIGLALWVGVILLAVIARALIL